MSKSLLIVDDSATMRMIIMKSIRNSGLKFDEPQEAGNGIEALDKLTSGPVDIILCNINMPEMNGVELVKKVRQLASCKDTKIIMVSTESDRGFIENVMALRVNDYITKPFTPNTFREKLARFM
jgi:two-component system, chemotaxis family, chemotaxis protein CheY